MNSDTKVLLSAIIKSVVAPLSTVRRLMAIAAARAELVTRSSARLWAKHGPVRSALQLRREPSVGGGALGGRPMSKPHRRQDTIQDVFRALGLEDATDRKQFEMLATLAQLGEEPKIIRCDDLSDTRNNTLKDGGYAKLERSS